MTGAEQGAPFNQCTVYSGLPEVVHILPNCLHSILNRYSFILIQSEFTFKQAQRSHSQHMVILATPEVLHYNTGGLCDALHRTKRISSLSLFLPLSFSFPLALLPCPLYTQRHRKHHQAKYIRNSTAFCMQYEQQICIRKSSLFSLSCSRLRVGGFSRFLFCCCCFSPAKETITLIYNNSCII